jgi:hypothetical protein
MPWHQYAAQRYFYRSIRVNGRTARVYVGRGPAAEGAAREIEERRAARKHQTQLSQQKAQIHATTIAPLSDLSNLADVAMKASLVSLGFHQHARAWRLKKDARPDHESTNCAPSRNDCHFSRLIP